MQRTDGGGATCQSLTSTCCFPDPGTPSSVRDPLIRRVHLKLKKSANGRVGAVRSHFRGWCPGVSYYNDTPADHEIILQYSPKAECMVQAPISQGRNVKFCWTCRSLRFTVQICWRCMKKLQDC